VVFSLPATGGREVRLVYNSPTANIDRSDDISGSGEPARYTGEYSLRGTRSLIDQATYRAGSRSVPRVNQLDHDACQLCFVFDKAAKFLECPRVMLPPLSLSNRDPGTDTLQVFQGDTSSSVFVLCNKPLADNMVGMGGKSFFLPGTLFQQLLCCFRTILPRVKPVVSGDL